MYLRIIYIPLITSLLFTVSCNDNSKIENTIAKTAEEPTNKVIQSSEIVFEKLNPLRGDKSPQAGTIWGDRNGTEATGFLAKFVDGFSSPPHIHNVTYRAVVIEGLIHNDDPKAEKMWMKPGSFWTQPQGESHITASKGVGMALVEIDNGPYLVKPIDKAFDNGERPINIDASNVIWLDNSKTNLITENSKAAISFLWENKGSQGVFIKLPQAYDGTIESDGTVLHSVVIQGELNYTLPDNNEAKVLDAGSYFGATSKAIHVITNETNNDVIIYIRTNGVIKIN